jgi:hypothetical protein
VVWRGASFVRVWFVIKDRGLEDMDRVFKDRAAAADEMQRMEIVRGLNEQDKVDRDPQENQTK